MKERIEQILNQRRNYTTTTELIDKAREAFAIALQDRAAAEKFVSFKHRLIQYLPMSVDTDELLFFARTYPDLIEQLIDNGLFPPNLAQELRQITQASPKPDPAINMNDVLRTHNMQEQRDDIVDKDGQLFLKLPSGEYPAVTSKIRNFNQKLYSVGVSNGREIIELDPNSVMLEANYQFLKSKLTPLMSVKNILRQLMLTTRHLFPSHRVDAFVRQQLKMTRVIPLDQFIKQGLGVCRHHCLLNAYFLSRLVEDKLLQGEIIHHRQTLKMGGAHAWNIFISKEGDNVTMFSMDSLWNELHRVETNQKKIDGMYGPGVSHLLQVRYSVDSLKKELLPVQSNNEQILQQIKQRIENTVFEVGHYVFFHGGVMLTLVDGQKKRVPHRVAELYKLLVRSVDDKDHFKEHSQHLQDVLQKALSHPRCGRKASTTKFYEEVGEQLRQVSP